MQNLRSEGSEAFWFNEWAADAPVTVVVGDIINIDGKGGIGGNFKGVGNHSVNDYINNSNNNNNNSNKGSGGSNDNYILPPSKHNLGEVEIVTTRIHNDFVIVMNDTEGAYTQGHNALLIGNDTHGYVYLSKDGAVNGYSGTSKKSNIPFDNLKKFMNDGGMKNYERFLFFSVSHGMAQTMMSDMIQEINSPYNPFTNNCGQAIENVFEKNNFISVPSNLSPDFSFDYMRTYSNGYYYAR